MEQKWSMSENQDKTSDLDNLNGLEDAMENLLRDQIDGRCSEGAFASPLNSHNSPKHKSTADSLTSWVIRLETRSVAQRGASIYKTRTRADAQRPRVGNYAH